jgi:prepilin-type N-terminal cleavage/methylation domain-containing protein
MKKACTAKPHTISHTKKKLARSSGFTIIEILIVLFIISVLTAITIGSVSKAKERKELAAIAEAIAARLDEARGNSISGKDGSSFGVKFDPDSYTYFPGTTYIPTSSDNIETSVSSVFDLSNTIPGADDYVVFSRITGDVGYTATVTVSHVAGAIDPIDVVIGNLGEVSVVE